MSSPDIAASPPIRRDETVQAPLLLAFARGYLDAYTWIIRGVMANAQTANLVLLRVYGTAGNPREAIEGVFTTVSVRGEVGMRRRSGIFTAVCVAFDMGAAVGAYATKSIPNLALGLPVMALLIALLRCKIHPDEERP
jgi:uncharacterized membrane protein YoaK (UPF0700 family)